MAHTSNIALTDEEVLRRVQLLGDALAEEHRLAKAAIGSREGLRDWHDEVRLLLEVTRLLEDDISERPAFGGWVSLYLRQPLLRSMRSRRAPVAVAAVGVIATLAKEAAGRSAAASVCSWFVPCLVRLAAGTSATTTVVAAATNALHAVARRCLVTLESVNGLLCDCGANSAAVRRCALQVLRTYLQAAKGTTSQLSVSAYTDALQRVLRSGMADAESTVRRAARLCFWALHILEPASTEVLRRSLPAGQQRQLAAERAAAMEELRALSSDGASVNVSAGAGPSPASAPPRPRCVSRDRHHAGATAVQISRTATLRDDLESAAASRARAIGPRSASAARAHRQLLRSARDGGGAEDLVATPYSLVRGVPLSSTSGAVPGTLYATAHRLRGDAPLLAAMESTDWSVRRGAVLQAQQMCENGMLTNEDIALVLGGLLSRLQDIHFRVVEGAQDCLRVLLVRAPTTMQAELHALLLPVVVALLRNVVHPRHVVCAGARHLLARLVRTHEPRLATLEAVLRAADETDGGSGSAALQQQQQSSAELLQYVTVVHASLLADVSVMRRILRCAVAHLRALSAQAAKDAAHRLGTRASRASWCAVLGAALLAAADVFRQVLGRLTADDQAMVHAAVNECFQLGKHAAATSEDGQPGDTSAGAPRAARRLCCVFAEQLRAHPEPQRGEPAGGCSAEQPPPTDATAEPSDQGPLIERALRLLYANRHDVPEAQAVPSPSPAPSSAPPPPPPLAAPRPQASEAAASVLVRPLSPVLRPFVTAPAPPAAHSTTSLPAQAERDSDAVAAADGTAVDLSQQAAHHSVAAGADSVAHFLRQRPQCRDDTERRRALLSLLETLRAAGAEGQRLHSTADELERLLVVWERDLSGADGETHHGVRWAVMAALQALLQLPVARSAVARQLTRVLGLCRVGLDDAFTEVQLQAAACLDALLTACRLPPDLCLSALASCVTRWLEGAARHAATPGWLALVHQMRRVVEQTQPILTKSRPGAAGPAASVPSSQQDAGPQVAATRAMLTAPVVQRVLAALHRCLGHCHPAVRLCAVLVLVSLRRTLGEAATAPFLAPLSAVQLHLVDMYTHTSPVEVDDVSSWRATAWLA